jgi:hypothetical protein
MSNRLDRLTRQLNHLPSLVGRLGLSIAEAQRELNADYLRNVRELMLLIKNTLGADASQPTTVETFKALLESLAPSRYQFTETTLEFSADLAEHLSVATQVGTSVGASVGVAAVAVNASVSAGYARDYRAAARITTVMHAYQSAELVKELVSRAATIQDTKLLVPKDRAEVDNEIWESSTAIYNSLADKTVPTDATEVVKKLTGG